MQRSSILLVLACASMVAAGCGATRATDPPAANKNDATRRKIVGTWERQSDLGPTGYQLQLNRDGTFVMREFSSTHPTSSASSSATSTASAGQPAAGGQTMYNRLYKVNMPLRHETKGQWTVEGEKLIRTTTLSNGNPMRLVSRIDKLTSTQFVEESDGPHGPAKVTYERTRQR